MPESTTLDHWSGDVRDDAGDSRRMRSRLAVESARPGGMDHFRAGQSPAWVIVSQLADPQWTARWIGEDGQGNVAGKILPAFRKESQPGGWQCLAVPAPGRWTLRLEYDARRGGGGGDLDDRMALLDPGGNFRGDSEPGAAGPSPAQSETDRGVT